MGHAAGNAFINFQGFGNVDFCGGSPVCGHFTTCYFIPESAEAGCSQDIGFQKSAAAPEVEHRNTGDLHAEPVCFKITIGSYRARQFDGHILFVKTLHRQFAGARHIQFPEFGHRNPDSHLFVVQQIFFPEGFVPFLIVYDQGISIHIHIILFTLPFWPTHFYRITVAAFDPNIEDALQVHGMEIGKPKLITHGPL